MHCTRCCLRSSVRTPAVLRRWCVVCAVCGVWVCALYGEIAVLPDTGYTGTYCTSPHSSASALCAVVSSQCDHLCPLSLSSWAAAEIVANLVRKMQRFVRSPAVGAIRQLSTKAAAAPAAAVNHNPPKKIPGINGRYAGAVYTAASKVCTKICLLLA